MNVVLAESEHALNPPDIEHIYYLGQQYDKQYEDFTEDLPFWRNQAKRYGDPVLELACGTGRVAIHLARQKHRVTGLDISDDMLEQARRNAFKQGVDVEWIKADVRDFHLGRTFALILFPFNAICHLLHHEDLQSCLTCVKEHLQPGGKFIIDVFNPRLDLLQRDPQQRYPHAIYNDPDGTGTVIVTENNVYDRATQINYLTLYYQFSLDEEEIADPLTMRIYFPQELDMLLKYNGFSIERKLGGDDEKYFTSESVKQLIVCTIGERLR